MVLAYDRYIRHLHSVETVLYAAASCRDRIAGRRDRTVCGGVHQHVGSGDPLYLHEQRQGPGISGDPGV